MVLLTFHSYITTIVYLLNNNYKKKSICTSELSICARIKEPQLFFYYYYGWRALLNTFVYREHRKIEKQKKRNRQFNAEKVHYGRKIICCGHSKRMKMVMIDKL